MVTLGSIAKNCLQFIANQCWLQNKILQNEFKQVIMKGFLDQELKPYQVSKIILDYSHELTKLDILIKEISETISVKYVLLF